MVVTMYVEILCPNYSGSTVVGAVLHRFKDVRHVGEVWKIFFGDEKKMFCFECKPKVCKFFQKILLVLNLKLEFQN